MSSETPDSSQSEGDTLIDLAVAGDQAALERLLMMHHGRLINDLGRKVPDNVRSIISVEDILQETYVKVFNQIGRFEPRGPGTFYGWVARIGEHRLFDAIKAERAAKRGGGRVRINEPPERSGTVIEWLEFLAAHERTPSMSAAGRESARKVRQALECLKKEHREALRMRYIEGMPVAEVAERMKRSEGAVSLLCHRAMKKLAEAMGSETQFFGHGE